MRLSPSNPDWHLRFGEGLPLSDMETINELYDQFGQHNWDWTAYDLAYRQRCKWLGAPRLFATVLSVEVGSSQAQLIDAPGLHLLPAFGAPVLHGESIKGACRAAVNQLLGAESDFGDATNRLFGTADSRGDTVFEDAWWTPVDGENPFALERETPEKTDMLIGQAIPIPRLVATGQFAFWLNPGAADLPQADEVAWTALTLALELFGLGSRKNLDAYGRLRPVG